MSYFSNGRYQLQNSGQTWSYEASGDALRFEVRSGDQQGSDPNWKERSEIRDLNRLAFGQTYTISYSFMIEPGKANTASWLMISQLHQTEDAGESGFAPVFDVVLRGERLAIDVRASTEKIMTKAPEIQKTIFLDSAAIVRGKWYDLTLTVKIDPFGHGLVDAWRDGVQIAHYQGAVGYNDARGPYWKMGIYRAEANENFAIDFKGLDITRNSRSTVADAPQSPHAPIAPSANDGVSGQDAAVDTVHYLAASDSVASDAGGDHVHSDANAAKNSGDLALLPPEVEIVGSGGAPMQNAADIHFWDHLFGGEAARDFGAGEMLALIGETSSFLVGESIFLT